MSNKNNTYMAEGITLKSYNLGESDKIFVIFSRDKGIIKAVAKGVKKPSSQFSGMLDPLNINKILLRPGKNLDAVFQCDMVKSFPLLRLDYDKLIYALFMAELVFIFANDGEASEAMYDLLIYSLDYLQNTDKVLETVIWFEMIFLSINGYQSNYENCDLCQNDLTNTTYKLGFSLNSGGIICNSCLSSSFNYKIINFAVVEFLRFIKNQEVSTINEASFDNQIVSKSQDLIKEYFSSLSERKIKTLSVFDSGSDSYLLV